jgi:hypothetical protein
VSAMPSVRDMPGLTDKILTWDRLCVR